MDDLLAEFERKAQEWEQRVRGAVNRLPDPPPDDAAVIAQYGGMSAAQVPGLLRILRMYTEAAEKRGRELERADVKACLAEMELREHKRGERQAESAYYHARTVIACGEHIGAAERGKGGE